MSVIFVILGFIVLSLILVHINLHKKKNELIKFIQKTYKTLIIRHKKISKIIKLIGENPLTTEIKRLSEETLKQIEQGSIITSQRIRAEVLIEEKMKCLISELEKQPMHDNLRLAIESYQKTQKKVDKNKEMYNKIIKEFLEACRIKPAKMYASFEKIDIDYPKLITE